jgi:methionyl-tRNA formyltransferase
MDDGLDTGPMLFQEEISIGKDETAGQLHDRMALLSGKLLVRSLKRMAGKPIEETPQDDSLSSYASKIGRDISLIDWTMDAEKISARIKGLDPRPGAYTTLMGKEIKLFSPGKTDIAKQTSVPGKVWVKNNGELFVETGKGLIEIKEMQLQGKKRISSSEFLRGVMIPEGTVLGI